MSNISGIYAAEASTSYQLFYYTSKCLSDWEYLKEK